MTTPKICIDCWSEINEPENAEWRYCPICGSRGLTRFDDVDATIAEIEAEEAADRELAEREAAFIHGVVGW